jgi:serine/threonine protein kinase
VARQRRKFTQVNVDIDAIERLRSKAGYSLTDIDDKGVMHPDTYRSMQEFHNVRSDKFDLLVALFGVERNDLLMDRVDGAPRKQAPYGLPSTEEWAVDESFPPSGWKTSLNGLQYRICRMQHVAIADHFARGKFYDLLSVRRDLRVELHNHLQRHAVVAKNVGSCAHLGQLLSCVPAAAGDGWWVIDRWIDGRSLHDLISEGSVPSEKLPQLMKDILEGLSVLHSHSIILRELNPECVLLPAKWQPAVITDFEMAKLHGGAPTVRPKYWPSGPFRAPELESDQVTPATDIFSWAAILLYAATGVKPDDSNWRRAIATADLPSAVVEIVQQCLSSLPSGRPKDCDAVRKAISKWT